MHTLFQRQVLRVLLLRYMSMCVFKLKTSNIYYLTSFLRIRNLGVAWLDGSGLGSLMRLQSECQPGQQSPQGLPRAQRSISNMGHHWLKKAHSHSSWLEALTFSSTCLWACLGVFTTSHLASFKVGNPREKVGL